MRLQDFSNLESTQESLILDEEKTILEHVQEPRTRDWNLFRGFLTFMSKV